MSALDDLVLATPADVVEAWIGGVMHHHEDAASRARALIAQTPIPKGMSDPIFVTPEDGKLVWHQARDITNPRAIRDLKEYLFARGLAVPREVSHAWATTMEHGQWAQAMRVALEDAIVRHSETAPSQLEFWDRVVNDLSDDAPRKVAAGHG